jgi:LuxR family maltose regulon positive regulatory protein
LTLDRTDGDPLRFWNAVLSAIRRTVSPSGTSRLSTLSPVPEVGYSSSVLPALVVDALTELADSLVLVIDDVHTIAGSPAVEGLTFLMLHLPPGVRLVLAGIYLPELPRARMRLEGRLTSITGSTLAFSPDEARLLLERAGVRANAQTVDEVMRQTEGWAAGLRIGALTYADIGVDGEQQLPRVHAEASEYLTAEVLRRVPEDVQRFLLHTCVCDRICGSLADALTGDSNGSAVLRWLSDHNVFTMPLAGPGEWYRYHGLFAEMLRSQMRAPDLPDVASLHRRAAEWFAAEGLAIEAFEHAVEAGAWDLALDMVVTSWLSMCLDGELHALEDMLDRLPAETVEAGPLARVREMVSLALGRGGGAFDPSAPTSTDSVADLVFAMEIGRIRADVDMVSDAATILIGASSPALHEATADLRTLALTDLGIAEFWAAQQEHAVSHLNAALQAARSGGRDYVELGCTGVLVTVLTAEDRLSAALEIADQGAELARRRGWEQTAAAATLWQAMGWVHYLRDELAEADSYLDLADEGVRHDDNAVLATICAVRSMVLSQRGLKQRALQAIEDGRRAAGRLNSRHVLSDYFDAELARLSLAVGRVKACRRLLQGEPDPTGPIHLSVARAELLLFEERHRVAWELMTNAVQEGTGNLGQRILGQTLLAVLEASEVGTHAGLDVLAAAVEMAAPERLIAPLLQFGSRIEKMLGVLGRRQPVEQEFIVEVLSHIAASRAQGPGPVVHNLTARETDILTRLDGFASLPEIAADLFVSLNTVKTHLRSLYRKLDVHGRREAVARAEELGLL